MSLTVDDLNAVRAQWEEWTADKGFGLRMEVRDGKPAAEMLEAAGLSARLVPELYVLVEIRCGPRVVFSEHVPYDAGMLRASVSVLARTIAGWGESAEGEADE